MEFHEEASEAVKGVGVTVVTLFRRGRKKHLNNTSKLKINLHTPKK